VIFTVEFPVAAVLLAVSVSVVPANDAMTPVGMPEAPRPTAPVKPFRSVTLMVLVPLAPCAIVRLFGDAERLKSAI
jgi:hypothetical protein